jgi:hypothetical protein
MKLDLAVTHNLSKHFLFQKVKCKKIVYNFTEISFRKDFEFKRGRRINPSTIPERSPVKEPPLEKAPKSRHQVAKPNSLKDSNILTWEEDPKKPKSSKKGSATLIVPQKQESNPRYNFIIIAIVWRFQ